MGVGGHAGGTQEPRRAAQPITAPLQHGHGPPRHAPRPAAASRAAPPGCAPPQACPNVASTSSRIAASRGLPPSAPPPSSGAPYSSSRSESCGGGAPRALQAARTGARDVVGAAACTGVHRRRGVEAVTSAFPAGGLRPTRAPEPGPAVVAALLQAARVQGQQRHKGGDLQRKVEGHGQRGAGREGAQGGHGGEAAQRKGHHLAGGCQRGWEGGVGGGAG